MICNSCGNDEFEVDSGHYFCTLCQTQSQDVRVEEVEETLTTSRPNYIEKSAEDRPAKRQRREWDHGRPWQTHEAWTLILRQQINALKKLGAHEKIDSFHRRIWFQYLAKCGIAFCTPEEKEAAKNNPMIIKRQRDKYPGTIEQPFIYATRKWRTMLRRGKCLGKKTAKRVKNEQEMAAVMQKEEFDEEDGKDAEEDPETQHIAMIRAMIEDSDLEEEEERPWMRDEIEEEEEDEEGEEKVIDPRRKLLPRSRRSYERHPSYMTLPRTMTFLYLAVMHTNPLTMPHDIIRWIENSDIPFNEAASRLPEDMKFSAADTRMFSGMNLYSVKEFRRETGKMAEFIGLTKLPTPNLQHLASRFIMELKLPGEMHQLVVQMMSMNPLHPHRAKGKVSVPPLAALSMACIVLMLKLLFGLNDHTERELSTFAQEVNKHSDERHLFVWSEWVNAQEAAGNVAVWSAEAEGPGHSVQEVGDLGAYLRQRFPASRSFLNLRKTSSSYGNVLNNERCMKAKAGIQESLSGILNRLQEKAPQSTSRAPLDWGRSKLSYVTDGVDFLENIDQIGLSADTLHSSACEESKDESDDEFEEEYLSSQDLFDSPARKQKRTVNSDKTQQQQSVVRNIVKASLSRQHRQKLDVETLAPKLVKALESYHRYKDVTSDSSKKHRAYERTVNVCASYLGMYGEDLDYYVQRIEMLYIEGKAKPGTRAEMIRRRFVSQVL